MPIFHNLLIMENFYLKSFESELGSFPKEITSELYNNNIFQSNIVFYLTHDIFKDRILPICNINNFKPQFVVQFVIGVPFLIRMPNNHFLHFRHDDSSICSFSFNKQNYIECYFPIDVKKHFPFFHKHHSIIEMTLTSSSVLKHDYQSSYFELLIDKLKLHKENFYIKK